MLVQLLIAPLFIAASAVAHPAVIRKRDVSLSEWSSQNLESYWRFKVRYDSLNCASQNGTDFYTTCCYPLAASQSASDLPAECTPTTVSCNGSTYATPTPTPDASSTDDAYDESTLPWCEAGDDGSDDDGENTYTDASDNGGSPSSDTYTPTTTTDNSYTDYSQPQPSDNSNSSSNNNNNNNNANANTNTNNNNGSGNSGSSTTAASGAQETGGYATYYYQNGNAGACGNYHSDYDMIGAIDQAWYGDLGAVSQYCGRSVQITNTQNGNTVTIVVADVCPTCVNGNSFDLSVGAFQQLAALSEGTFPITWQFV